MKIYFEKGDEIIINDNIDEVMKNYAYKDDAGRAKICDRIKGTQGVVHAVKEGMGHIEVLYMPNGSTFTNWIHVDCIDKSKIDKTNL